MEDHKYDIDQNLKSQIYMFHMRWDKYDTLEALSERFELPAYVIQSILIHTARKKKRKLLAERNRYRENEKKCVNQMQKTMLDNAKSDRFNFKEINEKRKIFSDDQVRYIRKNPLNLSARKLASMFDTIHSTILNVIHHRTYKDVI